MYFEKLYFSFYIRWNTIKLLLSLKKIKCKNLNLNLNRKEIFKDAKFVYNIFFSLKTLKLIYDKNE